MKQIQKMMKQAQQMQSRIVQVQEEMADHRQEASAGGGVVIAGANGRGELVDLKISPEVAQPEEVEMLQDLVLAAVNEALRKAPGSSRGGDEKGHRRYGIARYDVKRFPGSMFFSPGWS